MNYPLTKMSSEGTTMRPQNSIYSDEYAQSMCTLYLSDELINNDHNTIKHRYRLHAKKPHNVEMALVYDIKCPNCSNNLKLVGRSLNYHDLGLYACPTCDKK